MGFVCIRISSEGNLSVYRCGYIMYMHVSAFPPAGYTSLISAETDTLRKRRGDVSALYPCVGNKLFRPVIEVWLAKISF